VDECVASILGQSVTDFEFVIRDDGSNDDTRERLQSWAARDSRIRLFEGDRRRGPAGSSNFVVEQARAPLIARMDADDIADARRLERQLAVLTARPDVVLVGAAFETIDASGTVVRGADQARLLRTASLAPFCHSSIMFRRDAFFQVGGYRTSADKWEDVDLFLRLADVGSVVVLRDSLMRMRTSTASSRVADGLDGLELAMERMHLCLAAYGEGRDYSDLMMDHPERISSAAFIVAASGSLWAGQACGFTRRLRRRVDTPSAKALLWSAWADRSPATLRLALRARVALRNALARPRLHELDAVDWRPQAIRGRSA
jgi:hypothetical protein